MASKKTPISDGLVTVHLKLPSYVRDALNNECETTEEGQGQVVARAIEALLITTKPKDAGPTIDSVEHKLWIISQRLRVLEPDQASPSDTLVKVAAQLDKRMADVESKFDDSQVKTLQAEVTRLQTVNAKLTRQLSALMAVESAPADVEEATP